MLSISIHAPREGSDMPKRSIRKSTPHFNPRSPRGERPFIIEIARRINRFQSTLPARGATGAKIVFKIADKFQSTLPARGATQPDPAARPDPSISIHAPREGSDKTPQR